MKWMGIDYGEKRIGIALSDDSGSFALPHDVLANDKRIIEEIEKIVKKEGVEGVVVGESRDFKGSFNPVMQGAVPFAEELKEKTGLNIFFEPEYLTSREAAQIQGETNKLDASAAALILRSFLDKQ